MVGCHVMARDDALSEETRVTITGTVWNNIVQVNLSGRFDAATAPAVEQYLKDCISRGYIRVVLNMADVQYISSAGLRVVLAMTKELRLGHKGDLRIAALNESVSKVFELSGLYSVLKIFEDIAGANQSFVG